MAEKKVNGRTVRTQALYTSVPLDLLSADSAMIIETGEIVNITDTVLRVYLHMRNMYCVAIDSPNSFGYFESWERIAAAVGKKIDLFKKGVNRPDKILEKIGLLEMKRGGKGRSSLKIVKDIVEVEGKVVFFNSELDNYQEKADIKRKEWLDNKPKVESHFEVKQPYPQQQENTYVYDFDPFDEDGAPF